MYGIPDDLPLRAFVGSEFNQVCLGRFQIQLHASGVGAIHVEGRWELRNGSGDLVDSVQEHVQRSAYRIHEIIDVQIVAVAIDAPRSFSMDFQSGHRLTVYDESPQYEAFSIHLRGQPSIYI